MLDTLAMRTEYEFGAQTPTCPGFKTQRMVLKGHRDMDRKKPEEKAVLDKMTATTVGSCALHAFMLFIKGLYIWQS